MERLKLIKKPEPSLDDLAARIRAEYKAARDAAISSVEHAMTAGDLLIKAKAQVKHGKWLPWLKEHCDMSERTAQLYMKLAKGRPDIESKSAMVADLTLEGAANLIIQPDPPRTEEVDPQPADAIDPEDEQQILADCHGWVADLHKVYLAEPAKSLGDWVQSTCKFAEDLEALVTEISHLNTELREHRKLGKYKKLSEKQVEHIRTTIRQRVIADAAE